MSAALVAATLVAVAPLSASDCCDPKSPFRAGEGHAETAATCQNLRHWADRAPQTSERVSMSVRGELSAVHWNGVLAYLEMCDPKALRVVCVTYATNDMRAGDVVTFGGGYASAGKEWVVLDPCLASR
jgi:hypothetical protein